MYTFSLALLLFAANQFAVGSSEDIEATVSLPNATASVEQEDFNLDEAKVMSLITTERAQRAGCICYLIYKPICGTDGETYGNDCFLACARKQDPFLLGVCNGECPCCKEPYDNPPVQVEDFEVLFPGMDLRSPPHPLYRHQMEKSQNKNTMPMSGKD